MTQQNTPPRKWKFALLIWLFIYPVITLLNVVFNPYMTNMPLAIRTLILSLILVPVMAFFYIPFISKHFYSWLRK